MNARLVAREMEESVSVQKSMVPAEKIAEFSEAMVREAERRGYFYDKYTGCCAQFTMADWGKNGDALTLLFNNGAKSRL